MSQTVSYPEDLKYTKEHEWVRLEDSPSGPVGVVGVTHFAQEALGDVVYLELPEAGKPVTQGKILGTIESVKAVSDLYAPVSGEVLERNEELMDHPEGVNQDPHGAGWMLKIKMSDRGELSSLMGASEYGAYVASAKH
ncbi:MAG: glycine cleavage system protein GcvH [Acidobacteriota bacterium]